MPINGKVNGSWVNGTPLVKTSNAWSPAKQVFAKVNGVWQTVYTSSISDNFNREDSASLGLVPDTDYTWSQIDGTWSILSNKAYSSTSASEYPLAAVEFNSQNVAIGTTINATGTSQASGNYGAGIAFWVVDSANWWGAYNDVTRTGTVTYTCASTYNGQPLVGQNGSVCTYDYSATATTTYVCNYNTTNIAGLSNAGTSSCSGNGQGSSCWSGTRVGGYNTSCGPCCATTSQRCPAGTTFYDGYGNCYGSVTLRSTSPSTSYSCPSGGTLNGQTCNMSNTASETTTYSYSQKVKLINSINNSVAVVNTYTVNDNVWIPANIQVTTSNNTVTLRAYANDDNTGSSWVQTYNATSPNKGTKHGLVLGPKSDSNVTQATSLDNFTMSAV